jgi:hypothetical protein
MVRPEGSGPRKISETPSGIKPVQQCVDKLRHREPRSYNSQSVFPCPVLSRSYLQQRCCVPYQAGTARVNVLYTTSYCVEIKWCRLHYTDHRSLDETSVRWRQQWYRYDPCKSNTAVENTFVWRRQDASTAVDIRTSFVPVTAGRFRTCLSTYTVSDDTCLRFVSRA